MTTLEKIAAYFCGAILLLLWASSEALADYFINFLGW